MLSILCLILTIDSVLDSSSKSEKGGEKLIIMIIIIINSKKGTSGIGAKGRIPWPSLVWGRLPGRRPDRDDSSSLTLPLSPTTGGLECQDQGMGR